MNILFDQTAATVILTHSAGQTKRLLQNQMTSHPFCSSPSIFYRLLLLSSLAHCCGNRILYLRLPHVSVIDIARFFRIMRLNPFHDRLVCIIFFIVIVDNCRRLAGTRRIFQYPAPGSQTTMIILHHRSDFKYSFILDYSLLVSGALIVPLIE